jgi:hypothetical protein
VKLYVTSQSQETLDLWSRILPAAGAIEFVRTTDHRVEADAVVMSGAWAFDRYGGRPNREHAQVLQNNKGDGLPERVIVPPFRPVVERDGEFKIREDYEDVSPTYFAFLESLRAASRELGESCRIAFDLPMLGMDRPMDESTPRSAARAIEAWLRE